MTRSTPYRPSKGCRPPAGVKMGLNDGARLPHFYGAKWGSFTAGGLPAFYGVNGPAVNVFISQSPRHSYEEGLVKDTILVGEPK